jgi:Kdo2-lipid IVA lauroyltransferase/acyltransferase
MPDVRPLALRLKTRLKRSADVVVGPLAVTLLRMVRRGDLDRNIARAERLCGRLGPFLPEHRIGRSNLVAAFPDKSPAEIDQILRGAWANLGGVMAEFANLDRIMGDDRSGRHPCRVEDTEADRTRALAVRDSGKPALVFGAHVGNWEVPPVWTRSLGFNMASIYRAPSIGPAAEAVLELRTKCMGPLIVTAPNAPIKVAGALKRGAAVMMLVDQHSIQGVEIDFFGRRCTAGTLIARLARQFECPIHGIRAIRLPAHRFRVEFTEPIVPPRAADGRIDVAATTQLINAIIEGWVREYPLQWLWMHRRWR